MSGYYGSSGTGNDTSGGAGAGGFYSGSQQQPSYGFGQQQQQQQQGSSASAPQPQTWMPQPAQQQQQQQFGQQQQQQTTSSSSSMMQPQQQQAPPAAWNPAAAVATVAAAGAGGNKDAMYDAAFSIGREFFISNTARMVPGLESTMMSLRYYFAVDNKYVVLKMKKILLPFISKQWRRLEKEPEGPNPSTSTQYGLPKVDENAPDLYLPLMSLITYVLLCAVCYGTAGKFNPEVIPDVTTKCFATQVLEVLAIRFGFYMMQAPIAFLDLFSYTGYKYLGLCINMVVGLVLGHFGLGATGYYITFVWTGVAASYFMLKTMANNIPVVTSATGPKREMMVLAFAASQFATMWFVSQTKFL